MKLERFVGGTTHVAIAQIEVNPRTNPSKVAIGRERNSIVDPGHDSFNGEIARYLIFDLPPESTEPEVGFPLLRENYGMELPAR